MQRIVRELFHGRLHMLEAPIFSEDKETPAFSRIEELEQKLKAVIDKEHLPLLQEYSNAYMHLADVCSEDEFVNGYRVGVQMMIAAWPVHSNVEE